MERGAPRSLLPRPKPTRTTPLKGSPNGKDGVVSSRLSTFIPTFEDLTI